MQDANLHNLPENYNLKYYLYHGLHDGLSFCTSREDHKKRIVGYVLAKMDDDSSGDAPPHGHITSLAVCRSHRKMGIATKINESCESRDERIARAHYVSLHVRESNRAAFHLYNVTLGYKIHDVEKGYYADGEDAYDMRKEFDDTDYASEVNGVSGKATTKEEEVPRPMSRRKQ